MDKILDGKKIKQKHLQEVKKQVADMSRKPGLAIILIGDNPSSELYVKLKKKACDYCDIDFHSYIFKEDFPEKEIIKTIEFLNTDPEIDGILVQLPLPDKFDTEKIISTIDYRKDIDGFHPKNRKNMKACHYKVMPPLPAGIIELINSSGEKIVNKNITVLCNHKIFGDPFICHYGGNNTVSVVNTEDKNWKSQVGTADVLIVSVGLPHLITKDMIKQDTIVIDVGINKVMDDEIIGDVHFHDVLPKVKFITPVPGGVGPATIGMLLTNLLKLAK